MRRRIVVAGAGAAGIAAALTALDAGAEVVLVEAGARAGGTLWVSGGLTSGAGARLQRAKGIEDSAEAHRADVRRIGRGRADEAVLALVAKGAGEAVDWLESLGARYTEDSPLLAGFELYGIPRSYALDAPAEYGPWKGRQLAEALTSGLAARSDDPHLRTVLDARVSELLVDDDRGVAGCQIERDGASERIDADAVVLATGGYAASPALLRRFHPELERLVSLAPAHAVGDGIHLAEQVGGAVVNADIVLPNPGGIEDPDNPGARLPGGAIATGRPPATAGDIWLDANGERFIAEDEPSQAVRERAIATRPGAVMFAVFDEPMRLGLNDEIAAWTRKTLADPRLLTSAGTLEELGQALGLPALAPTVARYNEAVAAGEDWLGRTAMPRPLDHPPFHAVVTRGTILMSFGGVRVDGGLSVLRPDGSPIRGLYAAGEALGAGQIQGAGYASGMMIVSAVVTGRHAAAAATAAGAPL